MFAQKRRSENPCLSKVLMSYKLANTELTAEQELDGLRRTTSKEHHQKMPYSHTVRPVLPVTVNILQRRRLSGSLFEKLCHSAAETFGSQGS